MTSEITFPHTRLLYSRIDRREGWLMVAWRVVQLVLCLIPALFRDWIAPPKAMEQKRKEIEQIKGPEIFDCITQFTGSFNITAIVVLFLEPEHFILKEPGKILAALVRQVKDTQHVSWETKCLYDLLAQSQRFLSPQASPCVSFPFEDVFSLDLARCEGVNPKTAIEFLDRCSKANRAFVFPKNIFIAYEIARVRPGRTAGFETINFAQQKPWNELETLKDDLNKFFNFLTRLLEGIKREDITPKWEAILFASPNFGSLLVREMKELIQRSPRLSLVFFNMSAPSSFPVNLFVSLKEELSLREPPIRVEPLPYELALQYNN